VALEPPLFVNLMVCELPLFVTTFPRLVLEGVAVIWAGRGFTVSVAALLVTLPTVLLTTTLNCAPLSEVVVAGVE
jgi:hypothetical protein